MRVVNEATAYAWLAPDKTGTRAPMVRATIQKLWLKTVAYDLAAVRYSTQKGTGKFATASFGQAHVPIELPNLKSMRWTRSVDQDAATCVLTLFNCAPLPLGQTPEDPDYFERSGWFTPNRGKEDDGVDRWGDLTNDWANILVPDRIIRTYEGYGSDFTLPAEDDPHMYPSGVWLIDDVEFTADGMITVQCRDLARLLMEQIMFPPVIPFNAYPLSWEQYHDVNNPDIHTTTTGWFRPTYDDNDNEYYIGKGFHDGTMPYVDSRGGVLGHYGAHAFDSRTKTYWLSVGNMQHWSSAYPFVQGKFSSRTVGAVKVKVWGGPYMVYVSVFADGKWQGRHKIPYRHRVVDVHADKMFVAHTRVGKGETKVIKLPKKYAKATKIRVTFSHLYNSGIGYYRYRAGCYDVQACTDVATTKDGGKHKEGNYGDFCADEQTEIFTKRGWLRYDEVEEGDEALGINPATGESEWQVVESVYRKYRERELVLMEGASHSSLTTPDHRWLVQDHAGRWTWRTTETLRTGHSIPFTAPRGDCPDTAKHDDAFVELAAWWWTEGSWGGYKAEISQSQSANPAKTARIRQLLDRLYGPAGPMRAGSNWNERHRADGVVHFNLSARVARELLAVVPWTHLDGSGLAPSMDFLVTLTQAQLDLFIDAAIDGDGWRRSNGTFFGQAREMSARAFEAACALAGRGTSTHRSSAGQYVVTVLRHRKFLPVNAERAPGGSFRIERQQYSGIIWCPTLRHHNWLARRNGSVYFTGNTDIVKWLLAWGGFYWPEVGSGFAYQKHSDGTKVTIAPPSRDPIFPAGRVWGDFEKVGTAGLVKLGTEIWDKKPLMDGISYIRDIVSFIFFIDESGGAVWRSPNIWQKGNYLSSPDGGQHAGRTSSILDIDERTTLMDYRVRLSGRNLREKNFVANVNGVIGALAPATGTTPPWYNPAPSNLRRVLLYTDQNFGSNEECQVMADLIMVRQMFTYRVGTVTVAGNPAIQIDDQVRIWERTTGESFLHYVRGIDCELDITTGRYVYSLQTHWLGTEPFTDWVVNPTHLSAETQLYLHTLGKI